MQCVIQAVAATSTNTTSLLSVPVIPPSQLCIYRFIQDVLCCFVFLLSGVPLLDSFPCTILIYPTPFPLRVPVAPPTIMYYGMTIRSQPTSSSVSPTSCATRTSAVHEASPTLLRHTMLTWWPSELDTTCRREKIRGVAEWCICVEGVGNKCVSSVEPFNQSSNLSLPQI